MQRAKHVLFDFDGTIADSREVLIELINQLAGKYGIKTITPENLGELRAMSILEKCRYLNLSLFKLPAFIRELLRTYRDAVNQIWPVAGILPVMQHLQDMGFYLSILSSNSKINIERFLANHDFPHAGDISCSDNLFGKDRLIGKYLKQHKLRPDDLIYIGDEQRDIAAARKNGVTSIWVAWGYDRSAALGECLPNMIAERPEELPALIEAATSALSKEP